MSDYNIPVSGGVNGLNVPLHGHIAVYNKEFPVIPNPEGEATGYVTKLGFMPEILQVKDPEVHDWARAEEKPTYTKAEVGLGNVDNTSDLNKPISTATQTALDGKVDKVTGKALSTNDYTDTDKTIVDGVTSALATKVDKIAGKGLSSNDYTDYEKTKLAYIQSGAEVNVQADWFEANRWSDAFILNKPTKLSDFSNDTGFITSTVDNLTYYYKKSETYTQAEVNALIGSIVTISFLVVQTLPQTGEANIIYLVPADEPNPDNIYEEYIYVNDDWEMIGTTKVDLSNYYTKTETDTLLNGKVDKDGDKVLSDNNYSDTDKTKLDGIEAEANKTIVDNALDGTSANPVENRVVKSALDEKLNADETAVNSNGLVIATPVTDTTPYIYRQTSVKESFKALMKKIVGASVVWNQILPNGNFVNTNGWTANGTATLSVANNEATIVSTTSGTGIYSQRNYNVAGHKILVRGQYKSTQNVKICNENLNASNTYSQLNIFRSVVEYFAVTFYNNTSSENTINVKNVCVFDLTSMFGSTIADYVYTLEQATVGSGIAWLQSYGFFTEDYYAYKQNKLESGCVSAHKTYDGETLLTNTELSPITLRGLFKLSTDKLTVDGDEYNADGSVTRKRKRLTPTDIFEHYSSYDSTTNLYRSNFKDNLNAITKSGGSDKNPSNAISNFDTCESTWNEMQVFDHSNKIGLYHNTNWNYSRLYISIADTSVTTKEQAETWIRNNIEAIEYELETPTTEQTTPFTEAEIVGSTEEFIDYEVAQNNRDVAIPVGTETDYYQEMKLPSLPTTSGNHNLIYNPASGFGWS